MKKLKISYSLERIYKLKISANSWNSWQTFIFEKLCHKNLSQSHRVAKF